MPNMRKQLADALQRARDLANENFRLKTEAANLRLISPQGERLSALLPADTKAWCEVEYAINAYVRACGGEPQSTRRPDPSKAVELTDAAIKQHDEMLEKIRVAGRRPQRAKKTR
jgi:hypothetical protein